MAGQGAESQRVKEVKKRGKKKTPATRTGGGEQPSQPSLSTLRGGGGGGKHWERLASEEPQETKGDLPRGRGLRQKKDALEEGGDGHKRGGIRSAAAVKQGYIAHIEKKKIKKQSRKKKKKGGVGKRRVQKKKKFLPEKKDLWGGDHCGSAVRPVLCELNY